MGACAQARLVHSIFIPCVPPYRTHLTAVYEIRLTAFLADNLMNNVAHCGGFYLRDIVEEKCRLRPACRFRGSGKNLRGKLPGLNREKHTDYAPLVGNFRGSTEEKHELRPACWKLPGLNREKHGLRPACRIFSGLSREKTWITPRLSQTSGAQQRKNMDYAPLVANFRGSTEKKRKLQGIS